MLRSLTVENFKSISSTTEIELAPLTIVTGSNSTGKSSLLQSLLLLLQTLRHSSPDRQLVLNGPLTQLGEYDDILNSRAARREIKIGIKVAPQAAEDDSPQSIVNKLRRPNFVEATWKFSDRRLSEDASRNESKTFPSVSHFGVTGYFEVGDSYSPFTLEVRRHAWTVERRRRTEGYPANVPRENLEALAWVVDTAPKVTGLDARGVLFNHCLPSELVERRDIQQEAARLTLREFFPGNARRNALPADLVVFRDLWKLVEERVIADLDADAKPLGRTPTLRAVKSWINTQPPTLRRRIQARIEEQSEELLTEYARRTERSPWLFSTTLPDRASRSIDEVRDSILGLHYLGPLRVQPAPIYPVATTLGAEDVGPSGEWTASVLDTYRHKTIEYIHPGSVPIETLAAEVVEGTLLEAVIAWIQYLGVADSVSTTDKGSLGHELTVTSSSLDERPLTHVGVGVSQCLPVVVSLLLAARGSTTLLEQPELHLHPAVQSRLGDFLLAMAVSGRQCIVETHSEYMVNRLRLRIAESAGSDIRDQIGILFAEQDDGDSVFRAVEVNEFGAIPSWPKGFFDDTQDDIERLLSASQLKRTKLARRS